MASDQRSENRGPRVLLLYYTYTGQALKVLEAAGEVFRERGCDVQKVEIEFTDPRQPCVARHLIGLARPQRKDVTP